MTSLPKTQSPNQIKVVIVGQDPYPDESGIASGIAFGCPKNNIKPSLQYIINDLARSYKITPLEVRNRLDTTLESWREQGVILWNASLTCEVRKPGSHSDIWRDFTAGFLNCIGNYNFDFISYSPMVFVLMGNFAQSFEPFINKGHIILKTPHPAIAAYSHDKSFVGCDIFNRINVELENHDQIPIKWLEQS
jgi:uracil-DNA glycosylase